MSYIPSWAIVKIVMTSAIGLMIGSVIFQSICQLFAESILAAS